MTRRLVLRPQAEIEIAEAAEWYETRGRGLSTEFLRVVDAGIAAIRRHPLHYPRIQGEIRRAPLRRFPYGIIYKVREEEILVLACFHARRDPKSWQERS